MPTPDDPADAEALARYATALADGIDAAIPGWVARSMPNLYPVLGSSPLTIEQGSPGSDPKGSEDSPLETGLAASIDPLRASTRSISTLSAYQDESSR